MRIGIDAKWFFNGPPSGIVVVRNILKHLVRLNHEDEFFIFLDKRDEDKPFPYISEKVHVKYVWADNNFLSNVLLIPLVTSKMKLDVFVFQNFAPLFTNYKRLSFVFDVIFKSNPEFFTFIERLYFIPLRFLTSKSNRVCTISESEKRRMIIHKYAKDDEIDVIHLGVDDEFIPKEQHDRDLLRTVTEKYNLPETFILYVGRLNIRKNIFNLLRAIELLNNKTVPLVIVGEYDWKMTSVETILDEIGIRDRVLFTGRMESKHIPAIFSLATVFTYPSFEEGFGLPPLEAMASGVPVIVSNSSSLPEICGEAAIYVDPHAPNSIAAAIDLLLEDTALYEAKRTLGLERAKGFNWRKSAECLMQSVQRAV